MNSQIVVEKDKEKEKEKEKENSVEIELLRILKDKFGFSSFRPLQQKSIEQFISGKDCFISFSTGGGKSLCYIMPALFTRKMMIVVSPLVSLMNDQVNKLTAAGISSALLTPDANKTANIIEKAGNGELSVLYITPEKLDNWTEELKILHELDVLLGVAIDEAHCISQYGHDFRPSYRNLAKIKSIINQLPIMALTATATPEVQKDVLTILNLKNPFVAQSTFDRSNLTLIVKKKKQKIYDPIAEAIGKSKDPVIVYARTVEMTHAITEFLIGKGYACCTYNAKMSDEDKKDSHTKFSQGYYQIIVATVAYGMGIDHPSIRLVVHFGVPSSIECYFQEAGRAGRDGLPSTCIVLWSDEDFTLSKFFLSKLDGIALKSGISNLAFMKNYCLTNDCRRKLILSKFGEEFQGGDNCGNCDNCINANNNTDTNTKIILPPKTSIDVTDKAIALLSVIKELGENTKGTIIDVLIGKEIKTAKPSPKSLKNKKTFGCGTKFRKSQVWWKELFQYLVNVNYINEKMTKGNSFFYSLYSCNPDKSISESEKDGKLVIKMEHEPTPISIPLTTTPSIVTSKTTSSSSKSLSPEQSAILLEKLNSLTQTVATNHKLASYHICSQISIQEMISQLPKTLQQLSHLNGWGSDKCHKFGQYFVDCINEYVSEIFKNLDSHGWEVEYAKSNRGKCYHCNEFINAGDIKLLKKELSYTNTDKNNEFWKRGFHPTCSLNHHCGGIKIDIENLVGFDSLTDNEKKIVTNLFSVATTTTVANINIIKIL